MSLLTTLIVKNNDILAEIYYISLKKLCCTKGFQYQTCTSVKCSEKQLSSKHILALFCKLVAVILS